jgi:hypothetical protein
MGGFLGGASLARGVPDGGVLGGASLAGGVPDGGVLGGASLARGVAKRGVPVGSVLGRAALGGCATASPAGSACVTQPMPDVVRRLAMPAPTLPPP